MFIIELGIWRFRSMCQFHTGLYIRVLHCIFLYLLVSHGIALYSTIFHGITTPAAMQQSFANDDCCSAVCLRHRSARQRMPCHLPCVLREILFVQFAYFDLFYICSMISFGGFLAECLPCLFSSQGGASTYEQLEQHW